ncbi:Hypothetical predicted protein, partial [Pelobates cultripes]
MADLPAWTGSGDPSPPQGGYPALTGTRGEDTRADGNMIEKPEMANAMRPPDLPEEKLYLETRLDIIFQNFWMKLEQRMHQEAPQQPTRCSPPGRIPILQQQSVALAMRKDPKWWRVKQSISHQPWAPCERALPNLEPFDAPEVVVLTSTPVSGFVIWPTLKPGSPRHHSIMLDCALSLE